MDEDPLLVVFSGDSSVDHERNRIMKNTTAKSLIPALLIGLTFLSACAFDIATGNATPTVTADLGGTITAAVETVYAQVTETARIAALSATATATPTMTASLTPSPTPTDTPTASETPTEIPTATATAKTDGYIPEEAIVAYFVSVGAGGQDGCGDSLIPVMTGHHKSGNTEEDLKIALNYLFSIGRYVLGLYNATYPSSLRVTTIDFRPGSGVAVAQLDGSYVPPATKCDAHRYHDQVWATAYQFDDIKDFTPHVGGSLLGDRLYASMLNAADE